MGLTHLSPSRASDFKQCPLLYRFRAVERLEEPVTVHQARGTTAHLALQRFFDHPRVDRTPERLYQLFREAWGELRATPPYAGLFQSLDDERAWGVASLRLLANYFSVEDPGSFEPLDRELDLLEEIGGMTIRGILDRIDRSSDGSLVITDYKTGRAPPERFARSAFFALKVYAVLVRRRTGEVPSELRLLYLNGPTLYRLPIGESHLRGVEHQLGALWAAIERALDQDQFPASPGRLCSWCSFRSLCPASTADTPEPAEPRRQPIAV